MIDATLTRLACRRARHDAERCLQNVRAGNAFTLAHLDREIDAFRAAYLSDACEPKTARRLHALIDMIEDVA